MTDLKSVGPKGPCGFESHLGYMVLSKASCESNVTDGSISNEYAFRLWPCGGIGRHARLKIWCPQGCVGSSPTEATKKLKL